MDVSVSFENESTAITQNTTFYPTQYNNTFASNAYLLFKEPDLYVFKQQEITFMDVERILLENRTMTYLNTIKDQSIRRATEIHLYHCPFTHICNFSLGPESKYGDYPCCKECSCNVDCTREGECCPNFVADFDELARVDGSELECHYPSLHPPKESMRKYSGYYFISDCPFGWDLEERKACRTSDITFVMSEKFEFSNVTPVTDNKYRLNYRNKFCALCHGVAQQDLLGWNVSLECGNSFLFGSPLKQRIIDAINSKECNIIFQPQELSRYTQEKCTPLISNCNQSGLWYEYDEVIEKLCHSPLGSSYDSKYKNVFCMICNNITMLKNSPSCSVNPGFGVPEDISFSALLNFRRLEPEPLKSKQCPTEMVFDPYLMQCRQLYCSPTKTLDTDKCVNILTQLDGAFFETEISFFPMKTCPLVMVTEVVEHIRNWGNGVLSDWTDSNYRICDLDIVYKINHTYENFTVIEDHNSTWYSEILNSNIIFISSRWKFKVNGFYEFDRVYEMIQNITNSNVGFQMGKNSNIVFLPRLIQIEVPVFDLTANLSKIYSTNMIPRNFNDNPLKLSDRIVHAIPSVSDKKMFIPHVVSNKQTLCTQNPAKSSLTPSLLIPCTMIELDEQRFDWNYTEYGVYVATLDLHLSMTDFNIVINAQGVALRICTDAYMASQAVRADVFHRNVSLGADVILSVVCTSISLLCLLLTLIVYLLFPTLRTVPGKNNMLLVINLFMAQAMYLVFVFTPTSVGSICKAVGVLLHFFWLSAIFWMHVCTFHMLKVFVRLNKPNSKTSTSKTIVMYTIIVIVVSGIFVLTNIIKALAESGMVEIGYGPEICYISSGKMVEFTFALPIGFVVVSNLVMFLVVIFKLRSLPSVEKNVKHDRNNAIIFVKLSSLTGITWIFGFLYVWTDEIVLSYFFIVLNASLGIFIMVSFTLNKRVFDLTKNIFSSNRSMKSGSYLRGTVRSSTHIASDVVQMTQM
ncbi:hypothetical protein CHS0354_041127 [Potamilus streckersoni]|uniref:G-protein coupled receptors family 2 profile 2 domain-containing protein n=1 Tax=Potamilus streckersoni TaxID=2493646 RepID=A0AAE0VU08_9BIVA|nr:hypothetical protein CHS0354_041127 [Potamilus streckersoni]